MIRATSQSQASQYLRVKVSTNKRENKIMGELPDGTMKVHLHAPREKGKANAALQKLLAEVFGTRADAIEIIAGHAAELKFIRVAGANK